MTDQNSPSGQSAGFDLNRAAADLRSAGRIPLVLAGIGVLTLICSFLPYYTVSLNGAAGLGGISGSTGAWHGFFGWAGALLALAAGVLAVLPALRVSVPVPAAGVAALFALAFVCTLLALVVWPGGKIDMAGIDYGHGVGYWLALLLTLAGTVIAGNELRTRSA